MKLKGAQILIKMIKEQGVDTIFGYPGGAVIDIYDTLDATPELRHILVRHEQSAVHAADAYARARGTVGVALVTSGPGATNTITGIASAFMDSIPVVIFTGQVPTAMIGNDAFQEVDTVGITRPCTKHNYLVKDPRKLAHTIKEAFYLAQAGRPGPVLVDLPKDIMAAMIDFEDPGAIEIKSYRPTYHPNGKQISKVVELIKQAKQPLILSGGGVVLSKSSDEVRRLAEMTRTPVTATLMGLGTFPSSNPMWLGMSGMHGTYRANMSISHCDLMIAVGVRFDDRVTGRLDKFAPNAKIIQIDIDPTSIHKNVTVTCPIVGDCKNSLTLINDILKDEESKNIQGDPQEREAWLNRIARWKATSPQRYEQGPDVIKPQFVLDTLHKLTNQEHTIVTTEVGQNQMWTAQYYHFEQPNHFITSGGLGVMGFGLPAALGAKAACPEKQVICVAGDASIQMSSQELMTAVESNLPVKIVILNNQFLGMVRQWQELFYEKRYAFTKMEMSPDFVKLAEAYGAIGLKTDKVDDVETVLKEGLAMEGTVIMEFMVDREECVYPMVPAGGAISEMILV